MQLFLRIISPILLFVTCSAPVIMKRLCRQIGVLKNLHMGVERLFVLIERIIGGLRRKLFMMKSSYRSKAFHFARLVPTIRMASLKLL